MIWTIIVFLLVLSVLVLAHEFGHYSMAKKFGAKVEEFGIGFPPRLYSWDGKDGMKWSINWIPIGGFVKIKGESGEDKNEPDSFARKPLYARFIILVAGVMMNLIVAVIFITISLNFGVLAITEGADKSNLMISDESVMITQILPGSPTEQAGIEVGDKLVSINSQVFDSGEAARTFLSSSDTDSVFEFVVDRNGEQLSFNIVPTYIVEISQMGVGAAITDAGIVRYPWYITPVRGVQDTYYYTSATVVGFYDIISGLFTGNDAYKQVSGPIGIATVTGEVIELGFANVLRFAAILSISLAVLNILPFPALDGGRLVFVVIEAIRRKPISAKIEAVVHNFGFLVLILVIILVTYKDIMNLL